MVSIKELCEKYRKEHGIDTTEKMCLNGFNFDFTEIIDINLNEPQLVCVGARPGMGRTAFYIDLILKTAMDTDKTVLFFFGGTPFVDNIGLLIDRLLRRLCGANDYSIIKNADSKLICNNTKKVLSALKFLEKLDIYFDTHKYPPTDYMKACISKYNNVGLVVVGNIEYIVPDKKNKFEKKCDMEAFLDELSILTKETNAPVVMTTTLNRSIEYRSNKHPIIRDLRLMRLRRLSDTVVLLYRDAYYTLNKEDNTAEILLAKNKNGNTGRIKMKFDYNRLCFTK